MFRKIKSFLKDIYHKLIGINDTPQKIAIGFGLGVFTGNLPGAGPVAAVVLASIVRVNPISALAGSLLTNTWISFITFIFAVKTGAFIMGGDWRFVRSEWLDLVKDFSWTQLFEPSKYVFLLPVAVGYLVISVFMGGLAYCAVFFIIKNTEKYRKQKSHKN
ncbi:MAG TPA: DUF2062 domain-containing protein [Candidatus Omnitrophota bacterium]|nr:DUF2062 domain-containing protein [Candidatus Omnitrophota bacterium]HPS20902.1 DUF2062 domain-containing protein [Candidatus Omnitrophota bacterium]